VYICVSTPHILYLVQTFGYFFYFKLNKHYQIKIGLHNLYMSSSHEIITASKLREELRAPLSTSGIGTRTVVPTSRFENFSLVNLNIFDACFSR